MTTLEMEIIERFRQLPPESRVRLLSTLQAELASQQISLAEWLAETETVRVTLRADNGGRVPTAAELVNEAREERDADILRSIGRGDPAGDSAN